MAAAKHKSVKGTEFNCISTFAGADPLNVIRARSSLIALPKRTMNLCINDIEKWHKSNGPQWTVDRLKYIKQCAINYLTMGQKPPISSEHWFQKNKQGLFKGHWGSILKLMVERPKATALFLQCYTAFATSGQPSERSIAKYKATLEKPFTGDFHTLSEINNSIENTVPLIAKKYFKRHLKDITHQNHYLLNARANNDMQTEDLLWVVQDFLTSSFGKSICERYDWVLPSLSLEGYTIPDYSAQEEQLRLFLGDNYKVKPFVIAKINWIHEPGLKERVVADYVKVLEFLTYQFGEKLYNIIRDVPWDATYHEDRGYEQISSYLKQDKQTKCFCFDLSKATDRFPLSTQHSVVKGLSKVIGNAFAEESQIFFESCKLPAELPNGELTHWEVGQPMGAYPSFALFSLTHGMVLMEYLESRGIKYDNQFVVHGDDLVIMDDELAEYYQHYINVAGAEINMFKTIKSTEYAELNSRLLSRKGQIRFPKWKPVTPASIMDQVETWGPKCIKWCYKSNTKQEAVRHILSIPYILPNGRSINPTGTPEYQRFMDTPDRVLEEILYPKPVLKEFTSFRQLVLGRFRSDSFIKSGIEVNLSSDLAELYFRMLNSDLDVADTLDREIQQDLVNFLMETTNIPVNHITNNNMTNFDVTNQLAIQLAAHGLKQFHELFGYEQLVQFNFIRQDAASTKKNKKKLTKGNFSTSRLNKLIKLWLESKRAC